MALITTVPEPNLWSEICEGKLAIQLSYYSFSSNISKVATDSESGTSITVAEYAARRPPFKEKEKGKVTLINYDPSKVSPVFYGMPHVKIQNEDSPATEVYDPSVSHPSCVGYSFLSEKKPTTPEAPPPAPDKKTCKSTH